MGLEPTRSCNHKILSLACLPIPALPLVPVSLKDKVHYNRFFHFVNSFFQIFLIFFIFLIVLISQFFVTISVFFLRSCAESLVVSGYRNKGYDFTITSSTAFDHKWINGRNIFDSISNVVDELFESYLSRPNVRQPILTQYCDGRRVQCPNWMTQWGSKALGDQNYTAIEILRNFYGDDMYINSAEQISGVPSSWPGRNLDVGSSGSKVLQLQEQLNTIGMVYSAIPMVTVDGIYGEQLKNAVRKFQSVFGLGQTGIVDYQTWYKIQEVYVGVTRIAELT